MVPGLADWHPFFRTGPYNFSLIAEGRRQQAGAWLSGYASWGSMSPLGNISLLALAIGAAPWCRRPSPLGRDALPKSGTSASPARLCLGDASAGLGLHHQDFLPKSLSTHEALYFRRYRRDISEAHFRAFWRQALPACRRCWALALQNAVNTVKKTAVLSGLLLFCPFCCCCGWLACCAVLAFCSRWFSGLPSRALDPSHKTLLFTVFCYMCVSGLACGLLFLGCFFWVLWRARACARPHVSLLGWGPAGAQKAGIPCIIWGWGGQHA